MSVESQIQAQLNEIAAVKQAFTTAVSGRSASALWTLCDAAADIPYENRVKGSALTVIDTNVNNVEISNLFGDWFRLHNDYFAIDVALTFGAVALNNLKGAVEDYYRWRVPQYFNAIMIKSLGQGMSLNNVFPRGDLDLGHYAATGAATGVFTDGSSLETTLAGPGRINVINSTIIGATTLTLAVTVAFEDLTTTVVAVSFTTALAIGTKRIVGEQALTGNHVASSGNGVVTVAATGQFKAGQKVLVTDNASQEVAEVVSIAANTSLTLKKVGGTVNALRNNYTTAASAKVTPLYVDVTLVTNSTGTNLDAVDFKFEPDRPLTL